jgi:hypothetical protein
MAVTTEEWVGLHRRCLDAVRAAIEGLDAEQIRWAPVPGVPPIAAEVIHLRNAEDYWMREVGFDPRLQPFPADKATPDGLASLLDEAERAHERLLRQRPDDPDVQFGFARACHHALYHLGRIVYLRRCQEPAWEGPKAGQPGTWEHAVDTLTGLLV